MPADECSEEQHALFAMLRTQVPRFGGRSGGLGARPMRQAVTTPVVTAQRDHARGRVYDVRVGERMVSVLLTFHALERVERWRLPER